MFGNKKLFVKKNTRSPLMTVIKLCTHDNLLHFFIFFFKHATAMPDQNQHIKISKYSNHC